MEGWRFGRGEDVGEVLGGGVRPRAVRPKSTCRRSPCWMMFLGFGSGW